MSQEESKEIQETPRPASRMKSFIVFLMGLLGLVYLLNPGAGVIEVIPDNLPYIGNFDEATATFLVIYALEYFGVPISRLLPGKDRR